MAKKKKPAPAPGVRPPSDQWDDKAAEEESEEGEEWEDETPAEPHSESLVEKAKKFGHSIAEAFHVEPTKAAESPKPEPKEPEKAKKNPTTGATLPLSKVPGKMRKFLND